MQNPFLILHSAFKSPSSIIPRLALLPVRQGFSRTENRLGAKPQIFTPGIERQFARRGEQGMTMEDDHFFPLLPRQFLQPLAQLNFLRNEQFPAESADFSKRRRLAKNKRSRRPFHHPADHVPKPGAAVAQETALIHPHRAATRQASSRLDFSRHFRKKLPRRPRIRVHKNQPLSARRQIG